MKGVEQIQPRHSLRRRLETMPVDDDLHVPDRLLRMEAGPEDEEGRPAAARQLGGNPRLDADIEIRVLF